MKISICAAAAILAGVVALGFLTPAYQNACKTAAGFACAYIIVAMVFSRGKKTPAFASISVAPENNAAASINFDDVAALGSAKASLTELAEYIKNPAKYTKLGARMPRGVLLYGPPGTGKTLLARALAGEAGVPFFALSGSDFVQMYVGVGAGRVRDLFKKARKAGKCVIFIDEIDALGKKRGDASSDERDQTLNALLSEMSGFYPNDGIIVLAATNRLETLDPALLRPGRFDRQIEVGLPGVDERRDILMLHSRNKPINEDVDIDTLARNTCSFSGASLEALLNEAAIRAAHRGAQKIDQCDIDAAFIKTVAGDDGIRRGSADERCAIALHEAGHAVLIRELLPENTLTRVSILPASHGTAGYNLSIPPEKLLINKADIEKQVVVLLGGRAAELLIGGEDALSSGASGDISRAAELVAGMIMDLGMGGEPAVALRSLGAACGGVPSSEAVCRKKLSELYDAACDILSRHTSELLALTRALIENESLNGKKIEEVFEQTAIDSIREA